MLEEFYVDNYKSLINITFRPKEQNLLLGLNNSGKTNLCQALKFLATTVHLPLDECADRVAGIRFAIANFYFKKTTLDFQVKATLPFHDQELLFRYGLSVALNTPGRGSVPSLEVVKESLHVTGGEFRDTLLLENTLDKVRLLHEVDFLSGKGNYIETTSPRDATMLNRLYDLQTNERANLFKKYLSWCQYYSLTSEQLPGVDRKPNDFLLNSNGSNLASVIYHLKTYDERSYRRLLSHLQRLDPRIDLINFAVPSEDKVFMFFEDRAGNRLPATNASSGTLRFLALLYILMGQPVGSLCPIIVIEEPENGIYVGLLKNLLEIAEDSRQSSQLIFTTHSPYFIDLFDNRLDSVFVLKGGKEHTSLIQPSPDEVNRNLNMFPLGEQHFREMLA